MANLSFRAAASNGDNTFTTATDSATVPTGTAQDDLEVIWYSSALIAPAGPPTHTTPAGWSVAGTTTMAGMAGGLLNSRMTVYHRAAPATPAAATLTSSANAAHAWTRTAHDNPDLAALFGQVTFGTWTGTAPTATSITTTKANALISVYIAQGTAQACTPDASLTERIDNATYGIEMAEAIQAAAGATGNKTASVSASTDGMWAFSEFWSEARAAITSAAGASTAGAIVGSSVADSAITAAAGAGAASAIAGAAVAESAPTAAAGVATSLSLAGAATAASELAQADGVATAAQLVASSVAESQLTAAGGAATTSTLIGGSVSESGITPAAGASTASTLASAGGAATITAASGYAVTGTLAGSAVVVASIVPASGVAMASSITPLATVPAEQPSGGYWPSWPARTGAGREKRQKPAPLPAVDVAAQQERLISRRALRVAEARDSRLVEQLRAAYAERDALVSGVLTERAKQLQMDEDDALSMILALAS